MVTEAQQGSDRVDSRAGDATPDGGAAHLSQTTWNQMDATAGTLKLADTEPPNLEFDYGIFKDGNKPDSVALTTSPEQRQQARLDSQQSGAVDGNRTTGAIDTDVLNQKLDQPGIESTQRIAIDQHTSDPDRYRSLDVLLRNEVSQFSTDKELYKIKSTDTDTLHLLRDTDQALDEEVWRGDRTLLSDTSSPTRSIRPVSEVVPGPDARPVQEVVQKDGRPLPERPVPEAVPDGRPEASPEARPENQGDRPERELTKQEKLFDPNTSPEDKIKIARELHKEGQTKITGPDGKTYDIDVKKVGNRELVGIFAQDDKGRSKPVLRGIVEKDGNVSKQFDPNGKPVDYQSDWAKKNMPDSGLVKHEPRPPQERPPEQRPSEPRPPEIPPEQRPSEPRPSEPRPPEPRPPEQRPEPKPPEERPPEKPPVERPPEKPPVEKPPEVKPPEGKPPEARPEQPIRPEEIPEHPERPGETPLDQSRTRLRESAEKSITDPAAREEFLRNMDQFEQRAKKQGLPPEEVAKTMDQTRRLLDAQSGATTPENRILAARGLARHLANPEDTNQGAHNTCGPTSLGERTLTRNPSRAAEIVASTAIDGQWTSPDGKVIRIPPGNLTPGAEERTFPPSGQDRTFATQLMNAALVNDMTQRRMPPEYYVQGRPQGEGDTGERTYYEGQKPQEGRRYNGHTGPELAAEARRLNGDRNVVLQDPATDRGANVEPIRSEQDLKNALDKAAKNGNLPLIVFLDAADPSINGDGTGPRRFHFVSVTGYDAATGRVRISNQWGQDSDKEMPVSDLYRAIKRRP